ncbi:FecR family protein [Flavobacterium algicola]|uniref:FecR family protein n=1 Tax=Flavobacterium algicola TaxID=556529 RepID=UPI001EFEE89D|nr:FecR domain-containing protein [Flavobacterium algicola]MCG9793534.1 FecR domain-containing protein [Flavobacterium algicola]
MSIADRCMFELELTLDDSLKAIYDDYRYVWNSYPVAGTEITTPTFKEVQEKLNNNKIPLKSTIFSISHTLFALTAILICMVAFYTNIPTSSQFNILKVADKGQRLTFTLPDSSIVVLNSESSVKYSNNFKDHRDVWLAGEAYFNVIKNPNAPFTVHTEDLNIEVLGTEFTVNSETVNKTIALKKGKVKVSLKESNDEIYLLPSEELIFNSNTKTVLKRRFDVEKAMAWKDNILLLEDEEFQEAKDKMNRFYGVNFIIKDKEIASQRITGIFKGQDLNEFISSLEFITNCQIIKNNSNNYLISKSNE